MTVDAPLALSRWRVRRLPSALTTQQRLERDVRHGLRQRPPSIPPRWLYDERGCGLFEQITRLPEYYLTRAEAQLLAAHAPEIAEAARPATLVELGAGTSAKTRLLLDALTAGARDLRFVPVDLSSPTLAASARRLTERYPTVSVDALVADFEDSFESLTDQPGRRLVVFLGGTIGNFTPSERREFFDRLRRVVAPGDHFLLGADLVKDAGRLVAAYDDSAGVTAAFNRNVIDVLRYRLRPSGLDADQFDHVARWNADESRIEMWLRARTAVDAYFPSLRLGWVLPRRAEVLTEISEKFEIAALHRELVVGRFDPVDTWTDSGRDYSLILTRAVQ